MAVIVNIHFIHPLMDTQVVCILATVNNAAVNLGCKCLSSYCFCFFSVKYPQVELLDRIVVLFLICNIHTGSHKACTNFIPPLKVHMGSLFSRSSLDLSFDNRHVNRCEVMNYCFGFYSGA